MSSFGIKRSRTSDLLPSGVAGGGVFNRPPTPEIPKALQNRAKLKLIVKNVENY